MDSREILDLENKLLDPTAEEPISLPLNFLRSITNGFSSEQELGRGGYGVVYKGLLRQGDSFIAVKKFHDSHVVKGDEQFQKVATSLIKHPNVTQLLGYCSEAKGEMIKLPNGKCVIADKQTRILCFEYMCNGGLDKHLSDESSGLEWNMRYKIIMGICHGLNFLHGCNIIHLDLKPQNILMDATMMPKIADFDLSRLLGEQKSQTVTKTSNPPGTRGYMAPEYIRRGVISKKADIFSLGVIIIEILKGCKDDYPDYGQSTEVFQHFTEKVLSNWRNRFQRSSKYTALELHTQQVKQCINIALECVHHEKEKRPNLSNIIKILNAAEGSYCVQNGEDLPVDNQIIHLGWEKDHLRGNTSYRNFGENQPSKRLQMQGNPVLLSELRPKGQEYVICVRISRMWEYRGINEQNDIKHLDLVLLDEKANAIYAEIPPDAIPVCKPHLEKGKIVYMAKITVDNAKPTFKVVDHPYMIRLNKKTIIAVPNDQPDSFPKYTFSLTPFTSLLQYLKKTEKFLDVIGRIIAVSNAANVYSSSGDLMMTRLIKLQDLSGNTIDLSLIGKRALEFDGETVLKVGKQSHVIAIFVGTLMKVYKGNCHFLSGTSACRWYMNLNDIPEIKAFQKSLPLVSEPIQHLYLPSEDDSERSFEQKTLLQLKAINHSTEKDKKYECTVTIITITDNKPWCYRACTIDNHTIRLQDNNFKCTKEDCTNTQFDWRYKIPFIVTDGTYSLEFMIFEKRGAELIGKSAETLRKQYDITQTPPEVKSLISHKFTFIVKVLYKSINALEPSFEVVLIKERFGKQPAPPMSQLYKSPAVAPSSTVFAAHEDLPLLLPIGSKNIQGQGETQTMDLDPPSISGKIISRKRDYEESASNNQEIQDDDYPKTKATTKGTSQRLR